MRAERRSLMISIRPCAFSTSESRPSRRFLDLGARRFLHGDRWQGKRKIPKCGRVRRSKVGCLLCSAGEVCTADVGGHGLRQVSVEQAPPAAHCEDMVLVDTTIDLPAPNRAAAQFVKVAAHCHQDVACPEKVAWNFVIMEKDLLYFAEIEATVLDIGDAKIRYGDDQFHGRFCRA